MTDDSQSPDASDPQDAGGEFDIESHPIPAGDADASVTGDDANDLTAMHDRWVRAVAELDNLRKRSRREMDDVRKYSVLPLMSELLNVLDNLDRAIDAAGGNDADDSLLAGVRMVAGQLHATLEQYGCTKIEAIGQPFDPNRHEAVLMEPTDAFPPNSVTKELRTGYSLFDRVIRPTQVAVATEAQGASAQSSGTNSAGGSTGTSED